MTGANGSAALPSAEQLAELIEDFTRVWQLVPRSARPVNKGLYERIRRQLIRIHHYVESRKIQIAGAAAGEGDPEVADDGDMLEEPPLAIIMRTLYMCTEEQWEQAQILMRMRRLSDLGRSELFAEQEDSHCINCGEFEPDHDPEACPALADQNGQTESTIGGDPPELQQPKVPDLALSPPNPVEVP